ncbi:MAG: T9SS type A sorting domain-containing protein [Flavobacteriaceae bacterium]|nr:T9SS type A sorting domain-containing protein [Flavobacteriaceae bacterium]
MYPNPATTEVRISNPRSIELEEALIFDLTGRLVATHDLREMGTDIGLDISNLQVATYTVIIKGPDGQLVKQLIKE